MKKIDRRGGPRANSGGARKGAGRKKGGKNALELGEVSAIRVAGMRVPKTASGDELELADAAQQRIIDVMMGRVHYSAATPILSSAKHIREEICGPIKQKIEHTGEDGGALNIVIKKIGDNEY